VELGAHLDPLNAFTTLDGSRIREVARMQNQTLAGAVVPPSSETFAPFHTFEEVYLFTAGRGRMRLGDEEAGCGQAGLPRLPARRTARAVGRPRRGAGAAVRVRAALQRRGDDDARGAAGGLNGATKPD
jgi:hypothetical protein